MMNRCASVDSATAMIETATNVSISEKPRAFTLVLSATRAPDLADLPFENFSRNSRSKVSWVGDRLQELHAVRRAIEQRRGLSGLQQGFYSLPHLNIDARRSRT